MAENQFSSFRTVLAASVLVILSEAMMFAAKALPPGLSVIHGTVNGAFIERDGKSLAVYGDPSGQHPTTDSVRVFPAKHWSTCQPEEVGLSAAKLDSLRDLVGGRGCVVRRGRMAYTWGDQRKSADVASAMKPVLSALMLIAVQEKKIGSVEERISRFEPRLQEINAGKDNRITWRHLASQTSGYGLVEQPGQAYSYNDFALALYYDTLMKRVYQQPGTEVLKSRLAEPLGFEDPFTFEAFGPNDRPGRLALSVRDFARFGLLCLRGGHWQDRQVIDPGLLQMAISSPLPADTPLTSTKEAPMLQGQRSIGGSRNITPVGPGYYSFNWWLNGTDKSGRRLFVDAPADAYVASGHGGPRMLWIIPSLDLIVSWNDAKVEDHDASPGNPKSRCNQAARLIREAVLDARPSGARLIHSPFPVHGASDDLDLYASLNELISPSNH